MAVGVPYSARGIRPATVGPAASTKSHDGDACDQPPEVIPPPRLTFERERLFSKMMAHANGSSDDGEIEISCSGLCLSEQAWARFVATVAATGNPLKSRLMSHDHFDSLASRLNG
jgi:hypothetical protein